MKGFRLHAASVSAKNERSCVIIYTLSCICIYVYTHNNIEEFFGSELASLAKYTKIENGCFSTRFVIAVFSLFFLLLLLFILFILFIHFLLWQGLSDAVEHRHGKQRVPLVKGGIGSAVCVNDIDAEELKGAIAEVWALHDDESNHSA